MIFLVILYKEMCLDTYLEHVKFLFSVSVLLKDWLRCKFFLSIFCLQDLRHVDINSKRSLFETRREDGVPKTSPEKICKWKISIDNAQQVRLLYHTACCNIQ